MTPRPEPCDHWVVCKYAHALLYCPVDATGKHHKECEYDTRSRPHTPAPKHKFSSEDLILLAHDEWKRREERKHLHNEQDWTAGFLQGFCTSRKWAREYIDRLRQQGDEQG
jgi:hypothetical protein